MIARLLRWVGALDSLKRPNVVLVGHSFCSGPAVEAALQDTGHIPQIEDPARLSELLVAFLRKLAP